LQNLDHVYYFDPVKLAAAAAAAHSDDVGLYPNPDLAVEIDISRPKIDRPGIYAALQVPEFWRANKQSVAIQHLNPQGKYVLANRSRFLPVRSEDVTRWVYREDSTSLVNWEYSVREWARNLK
jgi:Uma2 family endonuclease